MNILVVTPYPPVLHLHGGGVRMFHNIRILSEEHSVRVISFVENDHEIELLKSVEPICESIAPVRRIADFGAHWFSLAPFTIREFGTPEMHKAVDDAIRTKPADIVQCEYLQMAQYKRRGVRSILTAHETFSANAYRAFQHATEAVDKLRLFSRWMAMLNYEISMCNKFDRVVTMTKEDANYLRSYARRANICDVPIGIDPDYFQPSFGAAERPLEVLFIGNFRHTPNVEAASFLLDEVAPHFPKIEFVIAGSYLPDTLQKSSNTVFPGYVADTRPLFRSKDTIFAAPLFSGTGQRVKLLEAFAMGSPVITTSVGAAGFPIVNGKQAIIADTPAEFRAAVATLAASPDLRTQIGRAGRQMIVDNFTWDSIGQQFLGLVEEALSPRERAGREAAG
jgi:glycosyltransferase involved in cell wall biosynthesis